MDHHNFIWPLGQAVKTPPFHGDNMGSNPVGVTTLGRLAQLGERLPYKQDVGSSILSSPTRECKSELLILIELIRMGSSLLSLYRILYIHCRQKVEIGIKKSLLIYLHMLDIMWTRILVKK